MDYKDLLDKEIFYLSKIPTKRVEEIVDFYFRYRTKTTRVITSGMGKAGQIAHTFATTLSSTGTPAYFLHPAEAQHGDLGVIKPGDIIFVFTNSGETREIHELIQLIHNLAYGNYIASIAGKTNTFLETQCAEVLEFGPVEEICPLGLTPTTSTTCMSVISDLIVVGIMSKNDFTKQEYAKRHHSGYLGKKAIS